MNQPPVFPCYPPEPGGPGAFSLPGADRAPEDLAYTGELLDRARAAGDILPLLSTQEKNTALMAMAQALENAQEEICRANAEDLAAVQDQISPVMQDRLRLTPQRIAEMAQGMRAVAALPDPVGRLLETRTLENGLILEKTAVPLGLIAIIYESRPNVTSDAASLTFKAGSVCVLRGGKESIRSNKAIVSALHQGLAACKLPPELISLVEDTSRQSARELMVATGKVDLLIPRGGKTLIATCVDNAKVPCIQTGTGICHVYVDETADIPSALSILENAKTSRPSVCNAMEVCLIHEKIAPTFLPLLRQRLVEEQKAKGRPPVELRLDEQALAILPGVPAGWDDFDTEFLDYTMAVGIVPDTAAAIRHINAHSTGHSEAILTQDARSMESFTRLVDSAAVYVNASTRFTDGGVFGLGCEMGISTQKLHARGPMGLSELTSYKYILRGEGQIR